MFAKNSNISLSESVILLTFLGIILVFPLGVLHVFGETWREVSWQNATDIAMLEWTSAFFHVFLFLLLLEQYKASNRLVFVFLGCGFLGMGIMNFFYATNSPGTEIAMWIRGFSLLLGGICFSFTIPARKLEKQADIPGVLIKYIVPSLLLTSLSIWVAISLYQILPALITPTGSMSLFGKIFMVIPCAFFFFAALMWLHEYIKDKRRVDFLFVIVLLVYAQMILLSRSANTWGIIWWFLHIVLLVVVLIACVYMLVLSVYRSLVWKLIFSLGLAFSLTVLIASGIIQSFSEKQFMKNFQINLHERHRRILLESEYDFNFANYALQILKNDIQDIQFSGKADFYKKLNEYLKAKSVTWAPFGIEFGALPKDGKVICFNKNELLEKRKEVGALAKFRDEALKENSNGFEWSSFYYDNHRQIWVSTLIVPFHNKAFRGILFVTIDVSHIKNPNILKIKNLASQGGVCGF